MERTKERTCLEGLRQGHNQRQPSQGLLYQLLFMFSFGIVWKSGRVITLKFLKNFAQAQYNNFDKKNEKKDLGKRMLKYFCIQKYAAVLTMKVYRVTIMSMLQAFSIADQC